MGGGFIHTALKLTAVQQSQVSRLEVGHLLLLIISCQTVSAGLGAPSLWRKDTLRKAGLIYSAGLCGKDQRASDKSNPVISAWCRSALMCISPT
jgi:hypothetical protein